jgi:hypothetical protein
MRLKPPRIEGPQPSEEARPITPVADDLGTCRATPPAGRIAVVDPAGR